MLFVFLPTQRYGFLPWDDGLHVVENPDLQPPTWEKVIYYWYEAPHKLHMPMTYMLWAAEARLGWRGAKLQPVARSAGT